MNVRNKILNKITNIFVVICAVRRYCRCIMKTKNIETKLLFDDGRLTGDGAHDLLKRYYPKIASCINAGLNACKALEETIPEIWLPLVSRTRACLIHDHMEKHAREVFAEMRPNVVLSLEAGFLIVDFHGKIKMRFKKLSDDLQPYSVKTHQQRAYDDQTLFAPPATLVTAGYRLDSAGVFRDAHVVCWAGSELRWSLRLPEISETAQPIEAIAGKGPREPVVVVKQAKYADRKRAT